MIPISSIFRPYSFPRAMAEELAVERGCLPEASDQSDHDLAIHGGLEARLGRYRNKGSLAWWMDLQPCTGRPLSSAMAPRVQGGRSATLSHGVLD